MNTFITPSPYLFHHITPHQTTLRYYYSKNIKKILQKFEGLAKIFKVRTKVL